MKADSITTYLQRHYGDALPIMVAVEIWTWALVAFLFALVLFP
jgi:hypothetical protein